MKDGRQLAQKAEAPLFQIVRQSYRPVINDRAFLSALSRVMHGDPTPSEADIKVTRDLIRAGQLMKIEVLDHVVMGNPNRSSLRELGFFL